MTTPDYTEYDVHGASYNPDRDVFRLALVPEEIDKSRPFGAQLIEDVFTPDQQTNPIENSHGGTVYEGTLGDPTDGDPATLTIDNIARASNRTERRLGSTAARHINEGVIWVFPSNRTTDHAPSPASDAS